MSLWDLITGFQDYYNKKLQEAETNRRQALGFKPAQAVTPPSSATTTTESTSALPPFLPSSFFNTNINDINRKIQERVNPPLPVLTITPVDNQQFYEIKWGEGDKLNRVLRIPKTEEQATSTTTTPRGALPDLLNQGMSKLVENLLSMPDNYSNMSMEDALGLALEKKAVRNKLKDLIALASLLGQTGLQQASALAQLGLGNLYQAQAAEHQAELEKINKLMQLNSPLGASLRKIGGEFGDFFRGLGG